MDSVTVNRLALLSNELLLDIFEYLDGYDLCQAFYGLNSRFNTLLQLARLHILYNQSKENKTVWNTVISFLNPSQICVLSAADDNIDIDERVLSASKMNLRTVCLHDVSVEYLDKISQYFSNDNHIKCLSLKEKQRPYYRQTQRNLDSFLGNHGHRFTSLVYLSITPSGWTSLSTVSVTFLQLRHLSIENCYLTRDLLQFLQKNTPNLRSLRVIGYTSGYESSKILFKNIHELHIDSSDSQINLQYFFHHFPSLRRLRLRSHGVREHLILNGAQWQQLIELHLPNLKQWVVDFDEGINDGIFETFYTGEFWARKNVKAKMVINKTRARCRLLKTIYFGREWHFRYFDNLEIRTGL